jgi:prepilin peptidase CpaA
MSVISAVLVAVLTVAAVSDLKTRRIPNALTLGALLAGLCLQTVQGSGALLAGLAGAGLAALVALPFFALGALGGGDAKLLIAVGAFFGPARLPGALLVIALLGGVMAVIDAMRRGVLGPVLLSCLQLLKTWGTLGRAGSAPAIDTAGAMTIPYGVAIAAGALVWWFWGGDIL